MSRAPATIWDGFDESTRAFTSLGRLSNEKISMTADGAIYIKGGTYYSAAQAGAEAVIGGYHVQLKETFATFDEAPM